MRSHKVSSQNWNRRVGPGLLTSPFLANLWLPAPAPARPELPFSFYLFRTRTRAFPFRHQKQAQLAFKHVTGITMREELYLRFKPVWSLWHLTKFMYRLRTRKHRIIITWIGTDKYRLRRTLTLRPCLVVNLLTGTTSIFLPVIENTRTLPVRQWSYLRKDAECGFVPPDRNSRCPFFIDVHSHIGLFFMWYIEQRTSFEWLKNVLGYEVCLDFIPPSFEGYLIHLLCILRNEVGFP